MKTRMQLAVLIFCMLVAVATLQGSSATAAGGGERKAAASGSVGGDEVPVSRAAREEKAIQDARRQKLAEKEAALAAKEEELKKLAEKIDAQLKSLEETKKKYEEGLRAQAEVQKKLQGEKITRMVKLFKTMKAEQSGKLIDALPEAEAIILLERLDTKTVAKLVPYINQPRVVRWIDENLNIKKTN